MYLWRQGYRYLDISSSSAAKNKAEIEGDTANLYPKIIMEGSDSSEKDVRTWAQNLITKGYQNKKENFHVNLLAQRRVVPQR
mmetsp:Transcript_24408/g.36398  ORF Transcript_24408/g.36398 Transcript_24408/m.36398 type:complete len:82 (-) Transcript_24408:20-265(-)